MSPHGRLIIRIQFLVGVHAHSSDSVIVCHLFSDVRKYGGSATTKADVIAIGAEQREHRPGEWSRDVPRLFGELLRALSCMGDCAGTGVN